MFRLIATLAILTTLAACSSFRFPWVHRITVQQGNVVTQQMIDKLRPGMTKNQVRFVLGNPVIDDSLDRERWDYVYTIQLAGGPLIKKVLSVYFIEGRLSYFEGDFLPSKESEESESEEPESEELESEELESEELEGEELEGEELEGEEPESEELEARTP